jgi:hypothetical protein
MAHRPLLLFALLGCWSSTLAQPVGISADESVSSHPSAKTQSISGNCSSAPKDILPIPESYAATVLAQWQLLIVNCNNRNIADTLIDRRSYSKEQLDATLAENGLTISRVINLADYLTSLDALPEISNPNTKEYALGGSVYDARHNIYVMGGTEENPVRLLLPKAVGERFEIVITADGTGRGNIRLFAKLENTETVLPPDFDDGTYRDIPETSTPTSITKGFLAYQGTIQDNDRFLQLGYLINANDRPGERIFFLSLTGMELWTSWPGDERYGSLKLHTAP